MDRNIADFSGNGEAAPGRPAVQTTSASFKSSRKKPPALTQALPCSDPVSVWLTRLQNQLRDQSSALAVMPSVIPHMQQSSEQAEDALSRGVVVSLHSLTKTLTNDSPVSSGSSGNATSCMGPISVAMGKAGMLEAFVCQADNLR